MEPVTVCSQEVIFGERTLAASVLSKPFAKAETSTTWTPKSGLAEHSCCFSMRIVGLTGDLRCCWSAGDLSCDLTTSKFIQAELLLGKAQSQISFEGLVFQWWTLM